MNKSQKIIGGHTPKKIDEAGRPFSKKKILDKFYDLDTIVTETEWSEAGYDKQRNEISKALGMIDKALRSIK